MLLLCKKLATVLSYAPCQFSFFLFSHLSLSGKKEVVSKLCYRVAYREKRNRGLVFFYTIILTSSSYFSLHYALLEGCFYEK